MLYKTYSNTLPKNPFSSLPTSLLKASTSRQQSSGLRSFTLKHIVTSSFAFFTSLSPEISSLIFRACNRFFNSSISFCTESRLRLASLSCCNIPSLPWGVEGVEVSEEILSEVSCRRRVASASRRCSSAVTRDWMWSSRSLERVLSVCYRTVRSGI